MNQDISAVAVCLHNKVRRSRADTSPELPQRAVKSKLMVPSQIVVINSARKSEQGPSPPPAHPCRELGSGWGLPLLHSGAKNRTPPSQLMAPACAGVEDDKR